VSAIGIGSALGASLLTDSKTCSSAGPGEAGTIEDLVTLLNAFGERVRCRKRIAHPKLRRAQMLPCFVLAVEGADLDQPSIV
jgi:hypothetical protein